MRYRKTYSEQCRELPMNKKTLFMEQANNRKMDIIGRLKTIRNNSVINCLILLVALSVLATVAITETMTRYTDYIIMIGSLTLVSIFIIRCSIDYIASQKALKKFG